MPSICETLVSSINYMIMHWCLSINLFSVHCSYGLSLNPKYDSVVENKSYHRRELSSIPYIAFKIITYSTFFPFSYITKISYSGFTSHIMSKNLPSNFMCTTLSLGSGVRRYTPVTSKVCTALPSWTSVNIDANSASIAMVGNVSSYCRIWVHWQILFVHVLPLILPHRFYLIRLTALRSLYFSGRT